MRSFFLLLLLCSSLFLTAGIFAIGQVRGQSQDFDQLQIQGLAWHRSTLRILLVTPNNESWWNPIYINSTLRAMGQWNEAIQEFASNNSQYVYLASLKLEPTVLNASLPGFNIYVNWTQSSLVYSADDIGLTTLSSQASAITNCSINLATHISHGVPLADGDEQNVALHELGHSLGLGHTNATGDVMYAALTLSSSPKLLSTLDLYGVSTIFAWLTFQFNFYPVSDWLQGNSVFLPSSQFQFLPVSGQNAGPQTLENNPVIQTLVLAGEILIHPDFLGLIIIFVIIVIFIALLPKRREKQISKTIPNDQ